MNFHSAFKSQDPIFALKAKIGSWDPKTNWELKKRCLIALKLNPNTSFPEKLGRVVVCKRNGRSVLWVLMRNNSAGALTDPSAGVGTSPKRTACRPRYTRYVVSGISGVLESTAGEIGRGSKMGGRTDKLFQQARKRPHTHMNSEKVRATLAR